MANRKITVEGDSSQFRRDFEQTAKLIDRQLEQLGIKAQKLDLGRRDVPQYYRTLARDPQLQQRQQEAGSSVRELERINKANQREFEQEQKRIRDQKLPPAQEKQQLSQSKEQFQQRQQELQVDLNTARETVSQIKQLNDNIKSLNNTNKEIEFGDKSRHREFKNLSQEEVESNLKGLREAKERGQGDQELVDKDIQALEKLQEKERPEPAERLRRAFTRGTATYLAGQAVRTVGSAIGPTTGAVTDVGVNALTAGAINPFAGVGAGLIGLLGVSLQQGKRLEEATLGIERVSDVSGGFGFGLAGFGQSATDTRVLARQIVDVSGLSGRALEEATRESIFLSQGFGLGQNVQGQIQQNLRFTDQTSQEQIVQLLNTLADQRIAKVNLSENDFNIALLPKYIEQLVQLQRDQIERTGVFDSQQTIEQLGTFATLGRYSRTFSNEEAQFQVLQQTRQRFQNPTDDLQRFYNAQAILETNPELANDPLALEKIMENPTTDSMRSLIVDTYKRGRAVGGKGRQGDYIVASQLAQFTGGSITKADELRQVLEQEFTNAQIEGRETDFLRVPEIQNILGEEDVRNRALRQTGVLEKYEKGLENKFSEKGLGNLQILDKTLQALSGGASLSDVVTAIKETYGVGSGGADGSVENGAAANKETMTVTYTNPLTGKVTTKEIPANSSLQFDTQLFKRLGNKILDLFGAGGSPPSKSY